MNKLLPLTLLLTCAAFTSACSTPRLIKGTFGGDGGESPLIEVNVRTLPGCPVRAHRKIDARERMNSQGFVDLQIPVTNPSSSPQKFRYSWHWIGPDGLSTTDPAREVWRTAFIDGRDTTLLSSTSTVTDPTAVILRLSPSPK